MVGSLAPTLTSMDMAVHQQMAPLTWCAAVQDRTGMTPRPVSRETNYKISPFMLS